MSEVSNNAPVVELKPLTPLQEFWKYFSSNKGAVVGLVYIVIMIFVAVFADLIAPYSPIEQFRDALLQPPSWTGGYLLGTDAVGRDILSRLIHGARLSQFVGMLVVT